MRRRPSSPPRWSPPVRPDRRHAAVRTRSPATAADVSVERVILQAYRAIGDRHLNEPDFRKMSPRPTGASPAPIRRCRWRRATRAFTLMRDGREVVSRPAPRDPADGRAWGGMLAELFAASIDASPVLQQTDRGRP